MRSATPDHLVERSVETGVEREGARKSKNTDWSELAYWLAIQGDYRQYGSGPGEAYAGAKEDIEIWRQRAGDKALSNAFERAKALNLHGDALIDYLASTRNKYRPG
jgi:hypothetical protein